MNALFGGFKISGTIHSHYRAWKSLDILKYYSDIVWLKEKRS